MAMIGMDTAAARSLAARLDAEAQNLQNALLQIEGTVSRAGATWSGSDFHLFSGTWSAQHRPAMNASHQQLVAMAGLLRQQAAQQDSTSADGAGGAPGGLGAALAAGAVTAAVPPAPTAADDKAIRQALEEFTPGRPLTTEQINDLTNALNGLTPAGRQALIDDLISKGLLPQLGASMQLDQIGGIFGSTLDNGDRLRLYSALLVGASPAAVAAITAALPGSQPSLDGVGNWKTDKFGNPVYLPAPGNLLGPGGSANPDDVSQGQIGDCYFLSSLIATSQADPSFVASHIHDNGNGTTTVTLYQDGKPVPVTVTNTIPEQSGYGPIGVGTEGDGGNWPQLYEKAYAQLRGGYDVIDQGGWGRDGLGAITGQPVNTTSEQTGWTNHIPLVGTSPKAPDVPVSQIQTLLDTHHAVVIGTNDNSGNSKELSDTTHGLIEHHEYVVQSVNSDGTVTLRNPWDPTDRPTMTWSTIEHQSSEVAWTKTAP